MKIALVNHHITKRSGIERYVAELAERFAIGNEVHLITAKSDTHIEGVTVHKTPIIRRPISMQVASAAYFNTRAAEKLKKKLGLQIVHGQGAGMLNQDILTSQSCHKAAVAELSRVRGGRYGFLKKFEPRTNVVLAIERHNYAGKHYKKIIAVSQGVKRELMGYYGVPEKDIAVIPNGVNLIEFNPANKSMYRSEIRGRHGIGEDDKILLFCGYEFNRKGLMPLIESLPFLDKDVKVLVVGEDNRRPYTSRAAELGVGSRVVFAGRQSEIDKYYAAADVFVFPTAYEAFSLATLEAAATGLPLVMTRVNGTEELVQDGFNGFFVKREGRDIADKVSTVLYAGVEKLGVNARKTAESYSWDNVAEKTMAVYKEALES